MWFSFSEVSVKLHILIRVKIVTRFSFSEVSVKLHILIPLRSSLFMGGGRLRRLGLSKSNKIPYARGWDWHGPAIITGCIYEWSWSGPPRGYVYSHDSMAVGTIAVVKSPSRLIHDRGCVRSDPTIRTSTRVHHLDTPFKHTHHQRTYTSSANMHIINEHTYHQ